MEFVTEKNSLPYPLQAAIRWRIVRFARAVTKGYIAVMAGKWLTCLRQIKEYF
ncbi:hypothetical protein GXP67_05460 [Rhodocytophaga rosea]|uniref:Uncharacterized protein n=1 Tax=Rhodocytophaga rosea TaxID=2704465 RepID=A0A6C0GEF4_9BACT|nr:hypothetical protein [Rhodocytophaga rosea]QHT66153.1 hypothetical protein GXP67_05460 [Rhodocytophaga rosea]